MTINTDAQINQTLLNTLSTTKEVTPTINFETELQRQLIDNLKSQQDPTQIQSDASVEEFKRQLASMGASNYLQEQNMKKIEELIEKKKEELMDSLGLSDKTQPPLSEEAKKTALTTLDTLLSDYKKQLMEQMQASSKTGSTTTTLASLLQTF
ncbi:MAG: hypothetical protein PHN18_07435 [Sulfurospirillaceae bacterium]|nr:hypothetical protein [Sulfurospirillaceae bacterium]MDD2827223.1 hypothetical protein [Sulfurospirillaceae bacterium]